MKRNESLITDNLNLVHYVCHKCYYLFRNKIEYEDMASVGMVGLIKAAKRYNPERGNKFSTYAIMVIYGEIKKHIQDISNGGIRVKRGHDVLCFSLQDPMGGDEDGLTIQDVLGIEQDFTSVHVEEMLKCLDRREREVCLYRMAGFTQQKIAQKMGISQAQISRTLDRAKGKISRYQERVS